MLRAFSRAFGQLFSGPILTVIGMCTMLGIVCFIGVWYSLDRGLEAWLQPEEVLSGWWSWLSGIATLVLAYFLFPVVATAFVTLFLDRVARLVEERHYPHLEPAKGLPFMASLWVTLRFLAVLVAANVLLLFLLFFPPIYAIAWFVINGWLLGREYFELVAMRRLDAKAADSLRRRNGLPMLLTGMALTALLLVPLVALILPVLATAVMVHRFHELSGND